MKTVLKWAGGGAAAGFIAVTIFAVGELLGHPDAGEVPFPVVLIMAMAMGGLLVGAPAGGTLGGIIGALARSRKTRREVTAHPSVQDQQHAPLAHPTQTGPHPPPRPADPPSGQVFGATPAPLAPMTPAPNRPSKTPVDHSDPQRLNQALAELDALPGLESVAEQVRRMARRVAIEQERRTRGLATAEGGYHVVFAGPPGTGKTTVARVWGKALAAMGALPSGHVVETDRGGLVGQHVGSTAAKTNASFDDARGGVLFVDEAYALAPKGFEGTNDFGREAIEAILARMENDRATTAVVVAGYTDEMDRFLDSNPGLRSRFGSTVIFGDYDGPTLLAVADAMAASADYQWDQAARQLLGSALTRLSAAPPRGWANARSVRTILDEAVTAQADRLSADGFTDDELSILTEADAHLALASRFPQSV